MVTDDVMSTRRRERSPEMQKVIDTVQTQVLHDNRGGIAWLARQLNLKKQAISRWYRVPIERVTRVSQLTGIPKHRVRPDKPDLFPPPPRSSKK